jgi:hypothetical protein
MYICVEHSYRVGHYAIQGNGEGHIASAMSLRLLHAVVEEEQ